VIIIDQKPREKLLPALIVESVARSEEEVLSDACNRNGILPSVVGSAHRHRRCRIPCMAQSPPLIRRANSCFHSDDAIGFNGMRRTITAVLFLRSFKG
jgi:hypothetical protein